MTTYPPYLSPVDDGTLDAPGIAVPTPRDVAAARPAHVPVVDLPTRVDEPTDASVRPSTFSVRVHNGDRARIITGITQWRIHDGALSLYGPVDTDRPTKLRTFNPMEWTEVERLATPGGHA